MNVCVNAIKKEKCTGCGVCQNICRMGAISMETDREGFWYPAIDKNKCVKCGRCVNVCPALRNEKENSMDHTKAKTKVYAAWSLDQEIRYHSTSGGIFSELALYILTIGGYICGAVYDNKNMVRHFITADRHEISKLRQSKYVQSDMGNIYIEIGNLLSSGKILLFCGTPCQCAGVLNYCREEKIDTINLYLIDFICRGSNSPKVYRKFLEELEKKYQAGAIQVWFKNKTYGWNRFSTKIQFSNGKCYLKDRYHDTYIRGYIEENLFIRPSCAECSFKGLNRTSDITLADFWKVQLDNNMEETDKGTSLVMIHTKKGEELWSKIFDHIYMAEKKLEDVDAGNVCFRHSIRQGIHREEFMRDLDEMPVIDNIERFLQKRTDE